MLVDTLRTVTPCACTASGNCESAALVKFCTRVSAALRSVPTSKRDRQRVRPVAAAGRLHVDRALDTVDLVLDGDADGVGDDLCAGTGIGRRHLDRRRYDVRILRDRKTTDGDRSENDDDDGDDVGENRVIDEELRHGRRASRLIASAPEPQAPRSPAPRRFPDRIAPCRFALRPERMPARSPGSPDGLEWRATGRSR